MKLAAFFLVFASVASADYIVRVRTASGDPIPGVRIQATGPYAPSVQLTDLQGEWHARPLIFGGSACTMIGPSTITSIAKPGYTFDKTTFGIPCGVIDDVVEVTGTGTPLPAVTTVSAASYSRDLTGNMVAAAFGESLDLTTKVVLVRPDGTAAQAQILYVSAAQVNAILPPSDPGPALIQLHAGVGEDAGPIREQAVMLLASAPSLFAADGTGQGLPAAALTRIAPSGVTGEIVTGPIVFQGEDRDILSLFGTGFNSTAAEVSIGGVPVPFLMLRRFDQFPGIEEIDVVLPHELAGRGQMTLEVTTNGMTANPLTLTFP